MSKARDRIIGIFIEESTEIIQQLETELIVLEESPWDKSILNEIFRGVHTLKGNANSFGFTKLGGFVHYFEDLLDFYRNPNNQLNKNTIQLVFDAYDVIREVFEFEKNGIDNYPEQYESVLKQIKDSLNISSSINETKTNIEKIVSKHYFHHDKFDINEINKIGNNLKNTILSQISGDKKIYNVVMEFDTDLYIRGYNHTLFFKLFRNIGDVIKSFWYFSENLPELENFDAEINYIKKVSVYLLSSENIEEIEDVFEFIAEDNEVGISVVDISLFTINEPNDKTEESEISEIIQIPKEEVVLENNNSNSSGDKTDKS